MTAAGVFSPAARFTIYEAGLGRCVGCGRPDITAQHRRARGMGGTSDVAIGHPANGVPLCGDGVRGCHGWTERHPHYAALLGWRLAPGEHALEAPWFHRLYLWVRWDEEVNDLYVAEQEVPVDVLRSVTIRLVDTADLDRVDERIAALRHYEARRNVLG